MSDEKSEVDLEQNADDNAPENIADSDQLENKELSPEKAAQESLNNRQRLEFYIY